MKSSVLPIPSGGGRPDGLLAEDHTYYDTAAFAALAEPVAAPVTSV